MQEYRRLGYLGLTEVFVRSFEHDVRDAVTENIIGFFKQFLGERVVFIKIFTHTYELCSLSGKYKCFHIDIMFK
ncbi:unknown [Bacteroides sp. CAG:462]|nr:unknown [Bacteroides sp. CAG:462]